MTILKDSPPEILIIAHSGVKFDFPFLCSEAYRNNIDQDFLTKWKFVNTLEVFKSLNGDSHDSCVKLQCLLRHLTGCEDLRAHRALDDCFALKSVLESMAGVLGVSPRALIRPFLHEFDSVATITNISCAICEA